MSREWAVPSSSHSRRPLPSPPCGILCCDRRTRPRGIHRRLFSLRLPPFPGDRKHVLAIGLNIDPTRIGQPEENKRIPEWHCWPNVSWAHSVLLLGKGVVNELPMPTTRRENCPIGSIHFCQIFARRQTSTVPSDFVHRLWGNAVLPPSLGEMGRSRGFYPIGSCNWPEIIP